MHPLNLRRLDHHFADASDYQVQSPCLLLCLLVTRTCPQPLRVHAPEGTRMICLTSTTCLSTPVVCP